MFGVLIPVGPEARDIERAHALAAELRHYEDDAAMRLIVVDDAPAPRELGLPGAEVVRTTAWSGAAPPQPLDAHVAGTLAGLARGAGTEFVLKLDTDAAVIAPFAEVLRGALADPSVGVVGSYDRMSDGGMRDWSGWRRPIARASWPAYLAREGDRRRLRHRPAGARRTVRRVREAALRTAPAGAHCLGGAYAVSGSLLRRASLDPAPWLGSGLGEDVVVGLLCSAAGLRMRSLTGPGEPFALAWRGLPETPEALRERGASIVHSVKQDRAVDEDALRRRLHRDDVAPLRGAGSR